MIIKTRHNLLLFAVLLSCMHQQLLATDVSGTIVNQIWTTNNSPYRVVGDINVAGLTIMPGVTVQFAGKYIFEVDGTITAQGIPSAPIVFTGTTGWNGIYFNNSNPGSVLTCCIISNSVNTGITIVNSNPTITRCTVINNSAGSSIYGGGITVNISSGALVITDTIIANNKVNINPAANPYNACYGGGVYAIMNGTSTLELNGCTITNNQANATYGYGWAYGGGVFLRGSVMFNRCIIAGNSCTGRTEYNVTGGAAWGGGIYTDTGLLTMNNCIIRTNTASTPDTTGDDYAYGGGVYIGSGAVNMTNCIVQGNVASAASSSAGGGICLTGGLYDHTGPHQNGVGTLSLINCTVAYNNSGGVAAANNSKATIMNTILYFNNGGAAQITGNSGSTGLPTVNYSDVQGAYSGTNNINYNPLFLSTSDLIIVPGSLCIDAGNTNSIYNDICFPPSLGGAVNDIGAHGGPGAAPIFQIHAWPQIEVVLFGAVPGYSYELQASTDLSNWETINQFQVAHVGNVVSYFEPLTNSLAHRFYKLNVGP